MSEEIQIDQPGASVPGLGGLNYAGLASLGWTEGMWLPVIREAAQGVYVKLPKAHGPLFIRKHEIAARREAAAVRS